jgi:hypothetical protein
VEDLCRVKRKPKVKGITEIRAYMMNEVVAKVQT